MEGRFIVLTELLDVMPRNKSHLLLMSIGVTCPFSRFSFVTSERGRNLLLYSGCKFSFHRTLAGGDQRWKCTTKHCNAYLKYDADLNMLTDVQAKHNHPPPEPNKLERQLISNEAKRQATTSAIGVSKAIVDVMTEEGITMTAEEVKRIKVNIWRAKRLIRKKQANLDCTQTSVEDPPPDNESPPLDIKPDFSYEDCNNDF